MKEAIQGLIAGEALHTLFQPIIDGATREPIGYEALTRVRRVARSSRPPL
jgi:EAL domain-containing protein (putative c-di-GMP-specific phosphodiesterase class I)